MYELTDSSFIEFDGIEDDNDDYVEIDHVLDIGEEVSVRGSRARLVTVPDDSQDGRGNYSVCTQKYDDEFTVISRKYDIEDQCMMYYIKPSKDVSPDDTSSILERLSIKLMQAFENINKAKQ